MEQNHNTGLAAIDYDELAYASDYKVSAAEASAFAKVVTSNDLTPLSPEEKVVYYFALSRMAGLNPLNRPFEILKFDDGRETLYTTKRASDELRFNHKLNVEIAERETMVDGTILRVSARVTFPDGRVDTADGVVPLVKEEITEWKTSANGKKYPVKSGNWIPLNPVEYANAVMKAETKAKRRATLSAVGLGMLDESEIETVPRSRATTIDLETGQIKTKSEQPALSANQMNQAESLASLLEVASSSGITEEDLNVIATQTSRSSIRDFTAGDAIALRKKIQANPVGAKNWVSELRENGDVVQGSATVVEEGLIADPAVRSAQQDVWEIAVDSYGWTSDQLEAVCRKVINTGYRQATAEQLNKLYADLVSADEAARAEYLKAA